MEVNQPHLEVYLLLSEVYQLQIEVDQLHLEVYRKQIEIERIQMKLKQCILNHPPPFFFEKYVIGLRILKR